jgi:lipopolysaccharide biosynthesis glycosyltransferase
MSTEFACSRFLTPILGQTGWALFTDCDVLFLDDVNKLLDHADPSKAVLCVKHEYTPSAKVKMDDQKQTRYSRKNWSSVMLFNCDHPANQRLDLRMLNLLPGRDLHRFGWLSDDQIGELPGGWNWLVNEQPRPTDLHIAHFTLGGPWLPGWAKADHDDLWLKHQDRFGLRH